MVQTTPSVKLWMEKFVKLSMLFSLIQIKKSMMLSLLKTWLTICQLVPATETGFTIGNQFLLMVKNSKDLTTVELKLTSIDTD